MTSNDEIEITTISEADDSSEINNVIKLRQTATQKQIRGSSLLLAGFFVAKIVNFVTQFIIVRYLSQSVYGAFAYALSVSAIFQSLARLGLERSVVRFLPIYQEQKDYKKLFGTLILVVGTILMLSIVIIVVFFSFQGFIAQSFIKDQQAMAILIIMIFLVPFDALDQLLVGLLSVFAKPMDIFFRKNILAPGLRLAVVLTLVLIKSDVLFLTGGYLLATAIGVVIYTILLLRKLQDQGLMKHFNVKKIEVPWWEIFSFTIPLLTTDLVYQVMNSMDAVLLARFRTTVDIAAFRAVQPTALLNQMVMTSFALLFTPLAARMFARKDRQGINQLYWQTAIWIAVVSFPIFALTFSIARPITILIYGQRYENSAIILSLLSLGYYFNAATGLNGMTLRVYGVIKYIVVVNIITAIINFGVNLILIPKYGAFGAAIGTTSTLLLFNTLKQLGLRNGTGINVFDWHYSSTYVTIIVGAVSLLLVERLFNFPIYIHIALVGVVSLVILWLNRHKLDIHTTFPELLRYRIVRLVLGESH